MLGLGQDDPGGALAAALGARHVELDSIYHQPDWTPLADEEFRARVDEATGDGRWVVDGNYSAVREVVWNRADTVVWFDLPTPPCWPGRYGGRCDGC